MAASVQIYLQKDGILLVTIDDEGENRVFRKLGQYWYVGAVDKEAYPFEVQITVVARENRQ